ncbi:MAG: hypothetical protein ABIH69_00790, partial [bacterium]
MLPRSVYTQRRIILGLVACFLFLVIIFSGRFAFSRFQTWRKFSDLTEVKGYLKPGQVLFDSLLENGISREASNELVSEIAKVLNLTKLRVNDGY